MSAPARPERFPEGHRLGARYTVVSVLGEGASGVVYCATRDDDQGRVALKVIHRHLCGNEQIFKRYHREAAILKRLEGPHVVGMLDFFEDDGLLIIALDYIEGTSLEELMTRRSPLGADLAIEITLQICGALESAHGAGVVHRDLKPANVLIEQATSGSAGGPADGPASDSRFTGRVRVLDFGLAKVVHGGQMTTGLTEQDMIFGTPEYMAPEQVRGDDVDPRSDVYALGCMLYEMVVGEVPFRKRTAIAAMTAHLAEEPPLPRAANPDGRISAHLEAVILRALAKSLAERHQGARDFAESLRAAREHLVIGPARAGADDSLSNTDLALGRTQLDGAAVVLAGADDVRSGSSGWTEPAGRASQRPIAVAMARTIPAGVPARAGVPPRPAFAVPSSATQAGELRRVPARDGLARERLLWILVAVVFATLGVVIGTVFGTR